jgi:hypothetical protein
VADLKKLRKDFGDTPLLDSPQSVALTLAVLHHGLANLSAPSTGVRPASKKTVLETAQTFEEYLIAGTGA